MQFYQPQFLITGFLIAVTLWIFLRWQQHQRQRKLGAFSSSRLLAHLTRNISYRNRKIKQTLLVLSVFLIFCALARPQYGHQWIEVKRKGIDILFALDTSRSMLAADIKPNRLARARLGIMDFVMQLEGDRVGLIPFAGTSFLMCPLTMDYDAFTQSLNAVNTSTIPRGGTNIPGLIEEAAKVLENDANHKILILLTDGENLEGDVLDAARKADEQGVVIYTVGIGTQAGELVPLPEGENAEAGFMKDRSGKYVTSRLDAETLTEIAEITGGFYVPLGARADGLAAIYQEKLQLIPEEELAEKRQKVPVERFYWPLLAAFILLLVEHLIPEGKRKGAPYRHGKETTNNGKAANSLFFILIVSLVVIPFRPVLASEAEKAFDEENYVRASELYSEMLKERPDDPVLHFNYGTTAYKNNLFTDAVASFTQALKSSDLALQEKAYYNRGNALFKSGEERKALNPQVTRDNWQQALASYDGALQLNPQNKQAKENREFVEEQLKKFEQQPEQQQSGSDKQQQPSQNAQQNENGKSSKDHVEQTPSSRSNQAQSPPDQQGQQNDQQQQTETASASSNPEREPSVAKDQDAAATEPVLRGEGKMTRAEARGLLNALKNEEGELNFIPLGGTEEVEKNW